MQEYLSDELTFDAEDEKRLFRSENKAEKRVKASKKKRFLKRFQKYPGYDFRCRASPDSTRFTRSLIRVRRRVASTAPVQLILLLS